MRRLLLASLTAICLAPLAGHAAVSIIPATPPERRVALVVGVGDYVQINKLPNATRDARAVGERLSRIGFGVDLVLDPDHAGFAAAITRFAERARGAETCLVYFAGAGFIADGTDLLAPADLPFDRTKPAIDPARAIDAGKLLAQVRVGGCRVVMLLDSCRWEMPAAASARPPHLLQPMPVPAGSLVAFAVEPGASTLDGHPSIAEGRHAPFTWYLLRAIETPEAPLPALLRGVADQVAAATRRTGHRQQPVIVDNLLSLAGDTLAAPPLPGLTLPPAR